MIEARQHVRFLSHFSKPISKVKYLFTVSWFLFIKRDFDNEGNYTYLSQIMKILRLTFLMEYGMHVNEWRSFPTKTLICIYADWICSIAVKFPKYLMTFDVPWMVNRIVLKRRTVVVYKTVALLFMNILMGILLSK